ncbi:MAG: winged helix-turn-helix transcriptional regulator [Candidatus Margulisbacteria bacterium]|jgi:ATP-dependent DNA helicase RecG|nr:winged helix-turn-helix transcriptional regulator [Candidatus Margulisiibacteriota bacterium]
MLPDKVMDLIYTKYLKMSISYKGIQRIEKYPYPSIALREIIVNAIAHRDYSTYTPIQINVYADKMIIFNDGHLPLNWTERDLFKTHKSVPFNPNVARAFLRAGYIEAWGTGINKIQKACKDEGAEVPAYKARGNELRVIFAVNKDLSLQNEGINEGINERPIIALLRENPQITTKEIAVKLSKTEKAIESALYRLKKNGFISRKGARKNGAWIVSRPPFKT